LLRAGKEKGVVSLQARRELKEFGEEFRAIQPVKRSNVTATQAA